MKPLHRRWHNLSKIRVDWQINSALNFHCPTSVRSDPDPCFMAQTFFLRGAFAFCFAYAKFLRDAPCTGNLNWIWLNPTRMFTTSALHQLISDASISSLFSLSSKIRETLIVQVKTCFIVAISTGSLSSFHRSSWSSVTVTSPAHAFD